MDNLKDYEKMTQESVCIKILSKNIHLTEKNATHALSKMCT